MTDLTRCETVLKVVTWYKAGCRRRLGLQHRVREVSTRHTWCMVCYWLETPNPWAVRGGGPPPPPLAHYVGVLKLGPSWTTPPPLFCFACKSWIRPCNRFRISTGVVFPCCNNLHAPWFSLHVAGDTGSVSGGQVSLKMTVIDKLRIYNLMFLNTLPSRMDPYWSIHVSTVHVFRIMQNVRKKFVSGCYILLIKLKPHCQTGRISTLIYIKARMYDGVGLHNRP